MPPDDELLDLGIPGGGPIGEGPIGGTPDQPEEPPATPGTYVQWHHHYHAQ